MIDLIERNFVVYLTTFVATVALVFVVWRNIVEAAQASAERLNAIHPVDVKTEDVGSPLDRFVSRGRLLRLRLTFAAIPATLLFGVLVVFAVDNTLALIGVPLIFAAIGFFLPLLYYRAQLKRRQLRFEAEILDLTTGIGNALRSGMALPQAIEKVGERMTGPMKEELQVVLREYRLGVDMVRALDRMNRRMPCEDIRLLVSAIKLTTEAGGSLSAVLAEMTMMIRGRREFVDKVKALTAEGRFESVAMSCAPIVAFCFLYLIRPELMRPLYTTQLGWCTLGVIAALEVAGFFVIRKIVSVEV